MYISLSLEFFFLIFYIFFTLTYLVHLFFLVLNPLLHLYIFHHYYYFNLLSCIHKGLHLIYKNYFALFLYIFIISKKFTVNYKTYRVY